MQRLKILILNDYAYVEGGAGKVAVKSSIKLAEKGHEVVFFSAVGPVSKELAAAPFKKIICLNQKDILNNPNKINALLNGIYNWRATRRLKLLLKEWLPDIAHIHGVSKALSWATLGTIYSYGIPVIYTLHDYGLLCPNLGVYNFKTNKLCEFYKSGYGFKCFAANCDKRNYLQKLWRWFRYHFSKKILRIDKKINGYIAVSDFVANFFKGYLPKDKPIAVIDNPISYEVFDNINYCRNDNRNEKVFLFIGRLSTEKGVDLLFEAIKEVNAKLIIIGDGELEGICREFSEKMGKERIELLGWQDEKAIVNEMKKSDALILPSKVMETSGLVVMEAARFYLPSIVADHGGPAYYIKDGINGLCFQAGNAGSLVEAMKKIINDNRLSKKLGENARKTFENYSSNIDAHVLKLEKFYKKIINIQRV
ncbi:MAG: glycosyltransferase family 4 protein [Actinobacteria bacterium]|nr:glycosyltransferase family 4 protein [Actinomycetota bacterium]